MTVSHADWPAGHERRLLQMPRVESVQNCPGAQQAGPQVCGPGGQHWLLLTHVPVQQRPPQQLSNGPQVWPPQSACFGTTEQTPLLHLLASQQLPPQHTFPGSQHSSPQAV
jgi:hypothetical protein